MKAALLAIRRLATDRRGVSAIEFAIVAPLALSLAFSIFEAGWIMTQSIMLDRAVSKTLRSVQVQATTISYAALKTAICNEAMILSNCVDAIRVELTPIAKSSDFPTTTTPCVDRKVKIDPVTSYNSGQRSQLIFARACFIVNPMTPGLGYGLSLPKDSSGGVKLISGFAFVNEPS